MNRPVRYVGEHLWKQAARKSFTCYSTISAWELLTSSCVNREGTAAKFEPYKDGFFLCTLSTLRPYRCEARIHSTIFVSHVPASLIEPDLMSSNCEESANLIPSNRNKLTSFFLRKRRGDLAINVLLCNEGHLFCLAVVVPKPKHSNCR